MCNKVFNMNMYMLESIYVLAELALKLSSSNSSRPSCTKQIV